MGKRCWHDFVIKDRPVRQVTLVVIDMMYIWCNRYTDRQTKSTLSIHKLYRFRDIINQCSVCRVSSVYQDHSRLPKLVSIDSAYWTSYWFSIVTMAISCIVSEIKRDIGWKSRSFILRCTSPLGNDCEYFALFSSQLSQMARLQRGAKYCGKVEPSK